LLHRDLPETFKPRVPEALGFEKAPDGTIKRLYMSWLRLGGEPLSHMEFSQQAAELLSVLHDKVGVIHLDLRLDNMVISDGRVCFLDFGSSVRVGEDIHESPLLSSLFDEMMNTSQIQRTMGKMRDAGRLTSDVLVAAQGKIDRGVDMFYLSLQISKPVSNPELLPLIRYDALSDTAKRIKLLTDAILRPTNPNRPHFISARDVFVGLQKIEKKLADSGGAD
ncbi:MAG: phosphotransferase, partial [Planctomycetota bacterium]